ncbi:MAG: hypothetical protein ACLQUY_04680 [Ktedonobacterales bacterium]
MLVLAVPGTALALLVLTLPGLVWAWWCYPAPDGATRLSVGLALGLALQMFLLSLLGLGPGITRASVAISTLTLTLAAVLLAWRTHRPRNGRLQHWRRYTVQLALVLGAMLVPRVIPLFIDTVPQGWDSSFHSLLASTTVATGRLPTWAPYEPIPLNYPYGTHLVIAALALLSGIAPDAVFSALLSVVVPLLTGLALYTLTRRALRRHDIAIGAVIAYGLLGNWGSLDYTRWGGLPNALGFALLLVFLLIFFAPSFAAYRIIVGGIVLGSIPLAHNHVMLTAGLVLGTYAGFLILCSLGAGRQGSADGQIGEVAARQTLQRLVLTSLVALAASGFYVVPLVLRAGELQDTSVLRLIETVEGFPFADNGWVLWGLALLGVLMLYASSFGYTQVRRVGRGGAREARAFVAIALGTLAVAFCLGYYGYRTYALHVYHQPYTAFTPSRFLTDMTYFLAIFAGIPLAALWQIGARHAAKLAGRVTLTAQEQARNWRLIISWTLLVRAMLVVVVLVTATVTVWPQVFVGNRVLPGMLAPGELEAFTWIREHTPKNTLVINLDPNAPWAPYFTKREVAYTPIPTDEFTNGYVDEKQFLVSTLLGVVKDPGADVVAVAYTDTALRSLLGRPVVILTTEVMTSLVGPPASSSGPEQVYLLPDGFSRLQSAALPLGYTITTQWWRDTRQAPPGQWSNQAGVTLPWSESESGNAPAPGVRYGRIVINGTLPAHSMMACKAEDGATIYLDGKVVPNGCTGTWVALPAISAHTRNVIAFQIVQGQDSQPWGDFFLRAG